MGTRLIGWGQVLDVSLCHYGPSPKARSHCYNVVGVRWRLSTQSDNEFWFYSRDRRRYFISRTFGTSIRRTYLVSSRRHRPIGRSSSSSSFNPVHYYDHSGPLASEACVRQRWLDSSIELTTRVCHCVPQRNFSKWPIFCSAARNYSASAVHLLKLVHDELLTNSHKAKFQPWVTGQCAHCSQRETFDHLMQCTNPMSHDFRLRVLKAIRDFGQRRAVPIDCEFIDTYLEGIEQWLLGHTPTLTHPQLDRAQSAIGWKLFIRGYLSMEWKTYLELLLRSSTLPLDAQPDPDGDYTPSNAEGWECYIEMRSTPHTANEKAQQDPATILSGLIRVVWSEMSSFWERHLDHIYAHAQRKRSPAKLMEVKTQIQQLHAARNKVLPEHRDRYFHDNLDDYLEHTDQRKLEQYLLHYKPAIFASIRRETNRQNNSIPLLLSFAGFTRQPSTSTRPPNILRPPEEIPHHKHTRWRPAAAIVATFRQFFQTPQKPARHTLCLAVDC